MCDYSVSFKLFGIALIFRLFYEKKVVVCIMLFSIIVPVYNVEEYLERCIESLINQTMRDIEIILVDDGSPDRCPEICEAYARKDNRIRVLHKSNGGLSDARNAGIHIANGDYIFFVDSDDYIELDACERFAKYTELGCDILIGDVIVEGGRQRFTHIPDKNIIFTGMEYLERAFDAKKAPMAAWLNVYRKEYLLCNNLFFKYGILHEDEQFTPRAFLNASSIVVTDVVFYHYIIRPNSIMTNPDKRKNARDLFETCCELKRLYDGLECKKLKKRMIDSLVCKYLSMAQSGKIYQYGNEYLHKWFIIKNAYRIKTRMKALIYLVSPRVYYRINLIAKR